MAEVLCRCTACATKFKVDAKYMGKKARCPKCTQVVDVPAVGSESVSSSTTVMPAQTAKALPKAAGTVPAPASSTPAPIVPSTPPPTSAEPSTAAHASPGNAFPDLSFQRPSKAASKSSGSFNFGSLDDSALQQPFAAKPVVEPTVDAVAMEEAPAADPFAIQLKKSGKAKPTTTAQGTDTVAHAPAGKQKKSALPLILGAAGVLVVGVIAVGILFATGAFNTGPQVAKNTKGTETTAPKNTGTLVIDWPEDQRTRAGLRIDKRIEPLTKGSALQFELSPGEHTLLLQRQGYSPVESKITITKGETTTFKPSWEKNEFGNSGPTVVTKTPGASSGGTDFQVGMATGPTITGFEGFTQNFYRAKEIAAKDQKDILIVFGSSDGHAETKALSGALANARNQVQQFIPVIVDFPQTPEARGNIQDYATNISMAQEFSLHTIPMMVMLDHRGKSYYLQEKWPKGHSDVAAYFTEAAAARKERDELWGAVKGETLEPAAKFVNWLTEKRLAFRYGDELKQWMPVAMRLDPKNDQGQLEAFVEAKVCSELSVVVPSDETGVKQAVSSLDPFMEAQRFKNDDRGVRVHLETYVALRRARLMEDAEKHIVRAGSYKPMDPDLKKMLAGIKERTEQGRILSTGTGFFISEQGYILTNHHVIGGRGRVVVRLPDGKTVDGQVIASDEDRDMAIVKVNLPEGMKVKALAVSPKSIGRGIDVAAFGYPLAGSVNASLKFTKGGVSALPDASNDQMFTLDLRVNPGNSGGPLCDQRGNVVGMVTAKTRTNLVTGVDSYGMAVPSPDLVKFLDKHLPAGTPRAAPSDAGEVLPWSDVDAQVSPSVLLILKME